MLQMKNSVYELTHYAQLSNKIALIKALVNIKYGDK